MTVTELRKLTAREEEVLTCIATYDKSFGIPPSVRDIIRETSHVSTSMVNFDVNKLVTKGYVIRYPGIARGLILTSKGERWADEHGLG